MLAITYEWPGCFLYFGWLPDPFLKPLLNQRMECIKIAGTRLDRCYRLYPLLRLLEFHVHLIQPVVRGLPVIVVLEENHVGLT